MLSCLAFGFRALNVPISMMSGWCAYAQVTTLISVYGDLYKCISASAYGRPCWEYLRERRVYGGVLGICQTACDLYILTLFLH